MTPAAPPRRILFVCTGNICRSAMAEHLLRHLAAARGLGLEIRSAGIAAEPHYQMPEIAKRLLAAEGVAPFQHKARFAAREVLGWADTILVMTAGHRDYIAELHPELAPRVRPLREAAGFGKKDVEDPMGRSEAVFARCLAEIRESLEVLLRSGFR